MTASMRLERWALPVLSVLVLGSLPFLVHPWFDATNDGAVYLLTAKSIARGEGYAYLGQPFTLRGPGLSVLLAPLAARLGTGTGLDLFTVNLTVALFGAVCVVLVFAYQRARLGAGTAFLVALLIWFSPGFQSLATQVMSDVPGAALLVACLLVERWSRRVPSLAREVVLGACIGLSVYVRASLVLLVPAIALSRIVRREPRAAPLARRIGVFSLVALALVAPWSVRNRLDAPPAPVDQTMQYSAGTIYWHRDPADPSSPRYGAGEVLARVPENAHQTVAALGRLPWTPRAEAPSAVDGPRALLALALLAAFVVALVRRFEPAEVFLAASLGALALYPEPVLSRYLLPLLLFSLPLLVGLAREGLRHAFGVRGARVGLLVLFVAAFFATFRPRADWEGIEARHTRFAQRCDAIASALEPDARLGADLGWHLSLFLGRPVYSLRFLADRLGVAVGADRVIDAYRLDTIVLTEPDTPLARYLISREPPDAVRRLDVPEGVQTAIVRVGSP